MQLNTFKFKQHLFLCRSDKMIILIMQIVI